MKRTVPILLIAAAIAAFAWFGAAQIAGSAVTADEFVHVPVGYAYLTERDYSLDRRGNPPMMREWLALPLLKSSPAMRPGGRRAGGDFYGFGWEFMVDNAGRYVSLAASARAMNLIVGAAIVLIAAWAAWRIYGPWGGALTAALTALSPTLIAHSSLATLDAGAALFTLAALLAFIRMCERPYAVGAAVSGVMLGGALLAKYTGAVLAPVQALCVVAVFAARRAGRAGVAVGSSKDVLKMWLASLVVALVALNVGYRFHGILAPLGTLPFESGFFAGLAERAPWLRLPFPADYLLGLDAQRFATGKVHEYYLMGRLSREGWPHYFLITYLVKETLPALLVFAAAGLSCFVRKPSPREALILAGAGGIFLFYSLIARVDLGVRYLLPALPLMYVFCGRLGAVEFGRARGVAVAVAAALLVWQAAGVARQSPNLIAYYNEAAGGQAGGARYVLESNYDWGQSLPALKSYMEREGIDRIMLYNYSPVEPQLYGVRHDWVPCGPTEGRIAISPNFVNGMDPFQGRAKCFEWLRELKPSATAGSLYVYEVSLR